MTLSELNYAPEIAGAMLKRQEAIALLGARDTVVAGAYRIAQRTIDNAESDGIVFDSGQKAALVSNLVITSVSEVRISSAHWSSSFLLLLLRSSFFWDIRTIERERENTLSSQVRVQPIMQMM